MATVTGSDTRANEIFLKNKAAIIEIRQAFLNAFPEGKTVTVSKIISKHKANNYLPNALDFIDAINKKDITPKGTLAEWIYKQKGNPASNEVDNDLVSAALSAAREMDAELKGKRVKKPVISSATKLRKKLESDKVDHQIRWIEDRLAKEELAPGFLREDEKIMYNEIKANLALINELKVTMPEILKVVQKLNDRIN